MKDKMMKAIESAANCTLAAMAATTIFMSMLALNVALVKAIVKMVGG